MTSFEDKQQPLRGAYRQADDHLPRQRHGTLRKPHTTSAVQSSAHTQGGLALLEAAW